jgi:hypothetical protein
VGTLSAPDTSRLRECAGRVADLLLERAITAGGRSTWLGVALDSLRDGADIVYRTGDPTLYDGTAGISLSRWTAAAVLERDDLAEVAEVATRHAVSAPRAATI